MSAPRPLFDSRESSFRSPNASALQSKTSFTSSAGKPTHEHVEHVRGLDPIDEFDEEVIIAEGKEKINGFTWYLIFIAALSGLLFGYDTGVISAALVNVGQDLTPGRFLSNVEKEWVASATSCGALFGGVSGALLMDRVGRKMVLLAGDVAFVIGALLIATSFGLVQIIVGRAVLGLGVGVAAGVCAVYLSELAPTRHRGLIVGLQSVAITVGQFLSFCLGAAMTYKNAWRVLFAVSIPPAIFQGVALHFLPESPRFNIMSGRREKAIEGLRKVYSSSSDEVIERKADIIAATVSIAASFNQKYPSSIKRLGAIFRRGAYGRPTLVASALFLSCQLGGVNALMYYSATLFAAAGVKNSGGVAIVTAATNMTGTIIGVLFLDRWGRRRTLLTALPVAIVALFMVAMCFHFMTLPTGGRLNTVELGGFEYEQRWVIPMIVLMVVYLLGFAPSVGTIPYTSIELLPLEIRAIGTAIATCSQWGGNIIISATFLSFMEGAGPTASFSTYASILCVTFIFSYFCYPEPTGLSLEETAELFIDGFGVKKARAMHRARSAVQKESRTAEKAAKAGEAGVSA